MQLRFGVETAKMDATFFERTSPGSIADCPAEILNPQREIANMDKPTVTLVSLDIDTPVVFPDFGGTQGHIKFAGPAPAGLEISVTSSHPNIISVDYPTFEANPGDMESDTMMEDVQEEKKSRFSNYSMSSQAMRRTEHLTLLDDRFEKVHFGRGLNK